MKKNLTKKLMLSVLTLAFAVVSLGASTFAWFTMSGAADVGQFQGQVKGGEGVEIGYSAIGADAAAIKWKTGDITAAEIQGLINNINGADWKFDAVTPAAALDYATSYTFNTIKGQAAAGNEVTASTGTYVAFALHFKLSDTSTTKTFHLVMDEYKLTNEGSNVSWVADNAIEVDGAQAVPGNSYVYDVRSATRVALYSNESENPYKALFEYVDPTTDTVSTPGYSYKEVTIVDDPDTEEIESGKKLVATGALELYNSKMDSDIEFDGSNGPAANTAIDLQNYEKKTGDALNSNDYKQIAKLTANEVVTVNVLVWIEGWDAECLNALFSQKLALDLSFAIFEDNGSGAPKYN